MRSALLQGAEQPLFARSVTVLYVVAFTLMPKMKMYLFYIMYNNYRALNLKMCIRSLIITIGVYICVTVYLYYEQRSRQLSHQRNLLVHRSSNPADGSFSRLNNRHISYMVIRQERLLKPGDPSAIWLKWPNASQNKDANRIATILLAIVCSFSSRSQQHDKPSRLSKILISFQLMIFILLSNWHCPVATSQQFQICHENRPN